MDNVDNSSNNSNFNGQESKSADELDKELDISSQDEKKEKEIDEQLAQLIKEKREEFDAQFAEKLSHNNSDGRILFAFTRRLLVQFRKKGSYSEAYVINEAYTRGVVLINKGGTIRKFSPWLRGTIYNIVRELSRGKKRENIAEFNEEICYQSQHSLIAEEDLNHELHLIRLAYEMLDAKDKQLLNLKIIERHTWREISEILRTKEGKVPSESALRKRKERALANLRKLYHEVKETSNMTSIN